MKKNGAWKRKRKQLFGKTSNLQQFINKYEKQFNLLTDREVEVLTLLAQGLDKTVIAKKLDIKIKTLQNYKSTVREKLGIKTETDYIKYALAFGLISF